MIAEVAMMSVLMLSDDRNPGQAHVPYAPSLRAPSRYFPAKPSMDRLLSMRAFVRVVDEQSFAGAARALGVDPAAVTRLIADLEAHLGARLLQRSSRRMALTSAGEMYLPRARGILADLGEAEALMSRSTHMPQGRLRVLVSPSFALHQVVRHLPRFYEQYPEILLDVGTTTTLETLDEAYDVSILVARDQLQDGDFIAHRLAKSHMVLCAAPAYLAAQGVPRIPADLVRHRALVLQTAAAWRGWHLAGDGAASGEGSVEVAPTCVLAAQYGEILLGAAISGIGIAALPSYVVEHALGAGALVRVLPGWSLSALTVYAAIPTRKYVPAKTRAFLDFMTATFKAEGDPWLQRRE